MKVIKNYNALLGENSENAKNHNIKIAIGTSEKFERVQFYLNKANIDKDTFNAIVCGDMVKNGKPAPDIYLNVCKQLDVNPEEAIVLEDSPNGIISAYRAKTNPVMVIDCIEPTQEIIELLYTTPLISLREVQNLLPSLKKEKLYEEIDYR